MLAPLIAPAGVLAGTRFRADSGACLEVFSCVPTGEATPAGFGMSIDLGCSVTIIEEVSPNDLPFFIVGPLIRKRQEDPVKFGYSRR